MKIENTMINKYFIIKSLLLLLLININNTALSADNDNSPYNNLDFIIKEWANGLARDEYFNNSVEEVGVKMLPQPPQENDFGLYAKEVNIRTQDIDATPVYANLIRYTEQEFDNSTGTKDQKFNYNWRMQGKQSSLISQEKSAKSIRTQGFEVTIPLPKCNNALISYHKQWGNEEVNTETHEKGEEKTVGTQFSYEITVPRNKKLALRHLMKEETYLCHYDCDIFIGGNIKIIFRHNLPTVTQTDINGAPKEVGFSNWWHDKIGVHFVRDFSHVLTLPLSYVFNGIFIPVPQQTEWKRYNGILTHPDFPEAQRFYQPDPSGLGVLYRSKGIGYLKSIKNVMITREDKSQESEKSTKKKGKQES